MHMTKNREIFLVQIATRPFSKHIYRSLRALLNSTLTRNEFGSFQTQPMHIIEGSKPCIYTFYTNIHTIIHTKTLDFHTQFVASIHVIFFFLSFFLLFFSLLLLLLLLLLLPFSSLFSYPFLLSFSKTKMRYLF